ncbi:MAG: TRAP transporter substrate-binding protein [Planctomycetes bacterium]|nr:TRAP transporter substrate-binding protein [Planctomycetota bacterium]
MRTIRFLRLPFAAMLAAGLFVLAGSAKAAAPAKQFKMSVGHTQATTSPRHVSLEKFKEAVEARTNGGIAVAIFPAGQLGNENEMTDSVAMGVLEAVRGGALEYLPKITMLSLPLLADNVKQMHDLCYSDFVMDMLSGVEEQRDMKVLAVGDDSGFRQITNNVRPIKSPADMRGLKMRTVLEIITLSMEAFGASTVSIPFTDLYMALKTGVADGQENPLALIDNQKFYEVQKYCSIINYMFFAEVMYVNKTWYESLPAEYQAILDEESRNMMNETSRIVEAENAEYLKTIESNGCQVYTLTDEERNSFRPAAETVWKKYIDLGYLNRADLDAMLKIVGKTVTW